MNQLTFIQKCRSIFNDNNGVRYAPHRLYGSGLDIGHLSLCDAGERRIFTQREKRYYADYQFVFLLDVSGSMATGGRRYALCDSAHLLYFALREAGAKVTVFSFNGMIEEVKPDTIMDRKTFSDYILKRITDDESGCNHDSEAVRMATDFLMRTETHAKILFVFSDGQPACDCKKGQAYLKKHNEGNTDCYADLHKAINQARLNEIVTLALGMQTESSVEIYGKRYGAYVKDLDKVFDQSIRMIERELRRG